MKKGKFIWTLFALLLTLPLLSLFALTFRHTNGQPFKWYGQALEDHGFTAALSLSALIAALTTLVSLVLSCLLALSWYDKRQKLVMLVLVILLGLLPGDILVLAISKLANLFGLYQSSAIIWISGLVSYTLPYNILLLWSGFYFIEPAVIRSARDLGFSNRTLFLKVILPLSALPLSSCAMLTFLLSFNEYSRTYYLSGAMEALSEYLNGQLSSGTDESIYAGAALTVLIALALVLFLYALYRSRERRGSSQTNLNLNP